MVLFIAAAAFLGGMRYAEITYTPQEKQLLFALDTIRDSHVGSYNEDDLYRGAIKGAVESLNDPFSAYLTPAEAEDDSKRTAGEMVGIGIHLRLDRQKQVRIVYVVPDGPADRAGLQRGDIILKIEGVELTGLPVEEVLNKITGKENTQARMTVSRIGRKQPVNIAAARLKVIFPSVDCSVKTGDILYISVSQFNDAVMNGIDDCASRYVNKKTKGIVLDLRNNHGGDMDAAQQLASEWVSKDDVLICTEKDRNGKDERLMSSGKHRFAGIKTAVLVNKATMSASEVVTGALQDYKLATVIGEKTFGKGVGQYISVFPDGSKLWLVSFKWYTPLGRNIHKIGLTPDIPMSVDPSKLDWDEDPVLDKALEFFTR